MADIFSTLFGGGAEKEAADANKALYAQYGTTGLGYLDSGLTNSTNALNTAKAEFNPYSQAGQSALTMLGNAYGLNGASGNAAASSAFTTSPGYDQGIDAGLSAISRQRAATGMLDSGNANIDYLNFAQNNQNQQYDNWLSGLTGLTSTGLQAASGQSGVDTNLSNLYQNDAQNRVSLQGNVTSGDAAANTLQAQGEAAGAKNLLGAGLGIASIAAGGGGLGSLGSSLGSALGVPGGAGSSLFKNASWGFG
jgi:hypothetical protein